MSYWRSLGQLRGTDEAKQFLEREFQEGASELPEGMSRREMLTLVGATLSLAGLTACRRPVEHIVPYASPPEEVIPGIPRYYATTMPFGRSAYGLVVESHEGRPTKIEGNALHPATAGAGSVRIQSAMLDLYDPDRAKAVRSGAEASSWAAFVAAWGAIAKTLDADGGASLGIVTRSHASPTIHRLISEVRTRYPRARFAAWEAVSDENVLAGLRQAFGRDLEYQHHFDRAAIVVALDADPLLTDPEAVRHTRGFAAGRRAGAEGGAMNRLYAIEPALTLTGSVADHRLRLRAGQIPAFVAALAGRLGSAGGAAPEGVDAKWLDAIAHDLQEHRGGGLILAGPGQPPEVHAAVAALNASLGNAGQTVTYREAVDAVLPSRASLADLVAALDAGSVKTVVVLDANPAYDAPADLDFAKAFGKATNRIVLSQHDDETAQLSTWHVPAAHFLEAWGDARAADGTLSIVQPLILPLFGGKSVAEMLALVASGQDRPGYDLVKAAFAAVTGADPLDARWNRALHDGLVAGSALPEIAPAVAGDPVADLARVAAPPAGGIELLFRASNALHDGRFANNPWLQELPDPLTKIVWDNPLLLSPKTAASLSVADGDVVKVNTGGRSTEFAVAVVPGQADGTAVATLGYGRTRGGRAGTGVGFDAYPLRALAALDSAGASIAATGAKYTLSTTQEHGQMEGRPLVFEATLHEFQQHPGFVNEGHGEHEVPVLWHEKEYATGHQWGMVIDLNSCVGCNACVVACQSENNIPVVGKDQVRRGREMHWIRVDRYFEGDPERDPSLVFQPVPCMHCENAPCEQVCPVAATVHDDEGLNVMVYNRCIGTRYCSNNCPYKVRRFNFYNFTKDTPQIVQLAQNPDVTVRARGVMEKCTYCVQRIRAGEIDAKIAGRDLTDGDIRTACQQACPAQAITFGDLRDPGSAVVKRKTDPRNYSLLEEIHSKPRTTYLAKLRNPHPALAEEA